VCRALKVLCVAPDDHTLAALRAATVSAEWELTPGATTETDALAVIDVERPQVLVAFGPYDALLALVRERFRGLRILADRDTPGASAVAISFEQVRGSIRDLPGAGGPVGP
jgi:hypothetical protein